MKAQDFKIFMRQAELSLAEKGLWCLILTYANQDGTNAFPSIEKLSHQAGEDIRSIKRKLKVLGDKGYLEINKEKLKGARHFHNVYRLKIRGQICHPYGGRKCHPTKSLNQRDDVLSVPSEAILRALPDPIQEDAERYG